MTFTTTLNPLPDGHVIAMVRFTAILGGTSTDIPINEAADFFMRNYITHRMSRFSWSNDPNDYAAVAVPRWKVDVSGRVTEVRFQCVHGNTWAVSVLSKPTA